MIDRFITKQIKNLDTHTNIEMFFIEFAQKFSKLNNSCSVYIFFHSLAQTRNITR